LKVKAYAKINLFLDILYKRNDNFHELDMIMQSISLHDTLYIKKVKEGIHIKCNDTRIPTDNRNIVYKVAQLFLEQFNIKSGVAITIKKRIPIESGLGGGSSDGAATLNALNKIFEINTDNKHLRKLAQKIGSDIPFCIEGGTKRAKGRGEIIINITPLLKTYIVLIKPNANISTPYAYSLYNHNIKNKNINKIIKAIELQNLNNIKQYLYNEFEEYILPINYEIRKAKELLNSYDNDGCLMTGSGSVVYALYKNPKQAKKIYNIVSKYYKKSFLCHSQN